MENKLEGCWGVIACESIDNNGCWWRPSYAFEQADKLIEFKQAARKVVDGKISFKGRYIEYSNGVISTKLNSYYIYNVNDARVNIYSEYINSHLITQGVFIVECDLNNLYLMEIDYYNSIEVYSRLVYRRSL